MKRTLRKVGAAIVLALLIPAVAGSAEGPDLSRIGRRIAREPKYTTKRPLYGLYVFGPRAETRVWAVLDQSDDSKADYDVLYFDRNANGDLTEPGERLVGPGPFRVGTFQDPATGHRHEKLTITRRSDGSVFLNMIWKG